MKINRKKILERLRFGSFALSSSNLIEQSDHYLFHDGLVDTFNGECRVRLRGISGIDLAVPSNSLIAMLDRFDGETVDIEQNGGELLVGVGARRAGLRGQECKTIDIPMPEVYLPINEEVIRHLTNAAGVCGTEEYFGATTCVHVTPKVIEATDNHRLYRWRGETGFPGEAFIPASSVDPTNSMILFGKRWGVKSSSEGALQRAGFDKVGVSGGWITFKSKRCLLSIRGRSIDKYYDLRKACKIDGEELTLPKEILPALKRAFVTAEGDGYMARVRVQLSSQRRRGRVSSRAEVGWYKEDFDIDYQGPALAFEVHPKLLASVIECSNKVRLDGHKIVGGSKGVTFVVALQAGE